jgi:hypothetical protein
MEILLRGLVETARLRGLISTDNVVHNALKTLMDLRDLAVNAPISDERMYSRNRDRDAELEELMEHIRALQRPLFDWQQLRKSVGNPTDLR